MHSGAIPDSAITASSSYDSASVGPSNGRSACYCCIQFSLDRIASPATLARCNRLLQTSWCRVVCVCWPRSWAQQKQESCAIAKMTARCADKS